MRAVMMSMMGLGALMVMAGLLIPPFCNTPAARTGLLLGGAFTVVLNLALLQMFQSLTVDVDPERVFFYFGTGWIKKKVPMAKITAAEPVRNKAMWGWGIRWYGPGWLYNVSGLDAVELTLLTGRKLRIGTDDPEGLSSAIRGQLPPP